MNAEWRELIAKDQQALRDAASFLGNYEAFMNRANHQWEKDDFLQMRNYHMKTIIRIGLERLP